MKRFCGVLVVAGFALMVSACGGGGGGESKSAAITQPGPGPGDQANYFPLGIGNTWEYQGVQTANNQGAVDYHRSATVTGTRAVNGVTATVVKVSSSLDEPTFDTYFYKVGNGIFSYGNSEASDTMTSQIGPYPELLFPVTGGTSFIQYSKAGLDSGVDLDGDGLREKVSVSATASVAGFETVSLAIGTFPSAARVVETISYTFTLSSNGQSVAATERNEVHLASGVGIIKQSQSVSVPAANYTATSTEELSGYLVDGQGKGVLGRRTLSAGVATADSDIYSPGEPSVAFDGTNFLVVSRRVANAAGTIVGTIVTPSNTVVGSFDIGAGSNSTGVAFGAGNYLLAFSRDGQIVLNRVTPAGVVLDGTGIALPSQSTSNFGPVVAFDGTNFLVVWQQFTGEYDLQGALVSPSGQILKQFSVFAAPGEQVEPAIAFDGTNYLAVWRDTRSGSGPSADTDITGVRIGTDGTVLDPAGIAISRAPGVQGSPVLSFNRGQYLAVWKDLRNGGSAIYGTRIATDGTVLDPGGIAIDTSHSAVYSPTVAPFGTNFVVAWRVGDYSPPAGVYGARISPNGQVVSLATSGAIFPISGSSTEYASRFVNPVIATGAGNSLIAWINNREVSGTSKDLESALLYPF